MYKDCQKGNTEQRGIPVTGNGQVVNKTTLENSKQICRGMTEIKKIMYGHIVN